MAPHVANFLLGSFGIVAAVLLIGGSVVLRAQQNRHRFELARKALDSGVPLPVPEPLWKGLHRQAQSLLAVGVGLMVVGAAAWWLGAGVTPPTMTMQPATQPAMSLFGPPTPPRPDAQTDAWHSAQERVAVGQTALACGLILTLLGAVRRIAAKTEREAQPTQPTAVDAVD